MVQSTDLPLAPPTEPHYSLQSATARAEEALRASEEKYRALYNALDEGFFLIEVLFDEQDRPVDLLYLEGNTAASRMLGQDWAGKRLSEIGSGFEPYWLDIFGRVARTGQSVRQERYAAPLETWFDFYVFKMGGPESRRIGNTFRDITDRKRAEEELRITTEQLRQGAEQLRSSEARFRSVLHNSQDIIYRANLQTGRYEYISPACQAMVGYTPEEWMALDAAASLAMVHPDDLPALLAALQRAQESGAERVEYRRRAKDGRYRWLSNHVTIIRDSAGRPLYRDGSIRDITDVKEAEQALRESREWLQVTLSSIGDAVIATDIEGRITFLNPVAVALTGWKAEEAAGQSLPSVFRIINEKTRAPGADIVGRVLRQGHVVALANHTALLTRDGREVPIEDSAAPILDESGAVRGVVLVFHDVTEKRRAEEALRLSEERFRSLAENLPSVLMRFDRRHRVVYLSPLAEEATGVPAAEFLGKTNQEVGMPEDLCAVWDRAMDEVFETGEIRELEFDIQSPAEPRTFWLKLAPEHGADGSVAHVLGVSTDVTERKRAEETLKRANERVEDIIASIRDNFFALDRAWRFTHANAEAERQFRKTREEMIGHNVWELFPTAVGTPYWDHYHKAMNERVPARFQAYYPPHDIWTEVSVYPTAEGIAVYCLDICELKRAEQALQEMNTTLEQRVAERTARLRKLTLEITRVEERERRRLAQVLHDHLQQLLAAARLSLTMVRHRRVDEARQAEILAQIDDLLAESIGESRSLTAELSPPVLYDAGLAAALEWLGRWIEQKHHLHVQVDTGEMGHGDIPEGIRLVLFQGARELLFNVAKHAGVDRARVELRRLPGPEIELVVSDGGAGFDPAKVARQSGGGFGLFSIRERLESLGGRIEVESSPGAGARVILRVPEQPSAGETTAAAADWERPTPPGAGPLPHQEAADERRVRVLLVDDHTIMRQGLAYLLAEEPDLDLVGQAANGQEAVELACAMHPDVVLMDVTMPGMDGVEATRLITREMPGVAVIGLSMHDGAEVAQRMREAGAVAHVPKGGDPTELLLTIRRCKRRL